MCDLFAIAKFLFGIDAQIIVQISENLYEQRFEKSLPTSTQTVYYTESSTGCWQERSYSKCTIRMWVDINELLHTGKQTMGLGGTTV